MVRWAGGAGPGGGPEERACGRGQALTRLDGADYLIHVYKRSDGVAVAVFTDREYPSRVAFTLGAKVADDFVAKYRNVLDTANMSDMPFPQLEQEIKRFQDPAEADQMMKLQKDLDETKAVLHTTIDAVLERGEKLDTLVERSEDLSGQSRLFFKQSKNANACCKSSF